MRFSGRLPPFLLSWEGGGVSEMGERVGRDCECAWFGFEVGVG